MMKGEAIVGEKAAKAAQTKGDPATRPEPRRLGLSFERYFSTKGTHPYSELEWGTRSAQITGPNGAVIFEQKDIEAPGSWSQTAVNIVAQKYFRGLLGTPERETSIKQLIDRVVLTITEWGNKQGYFATPEDGATFQAELTSLLINQKAAFNSPVWFNVGVAEHPQCSACFINAVDDTMDSILKLAHTEGMLFKWGSGTGTNFSSLRSSKEHLGGGGTASGPVSFMRGFDAFAGVIKSGGKTRRAAKMVILDADHPDIVEFIECKAKEERKAWTLIDSGYDPSFNGEAYSSIFFQNSNNSVRLSDGFMQAVIHDREWKTHAITDPERSVDVYRARDLMKKISAAAHQCGDPGLQFDTTVNDWHTCPNTDRIYASNPCSEYMFLDNSACNLASLNLRTFQNTEGELDVEAMSRAVQVLFTAQEILVDNARYPTPEITKNSVDYRPIGLGFANLGALLMSRGLPYDSEPGRAYAAAITALMHGQAYLQSARISEQVTGPFAGYENNREPFLGVMRKHRKHLNFIDSALVPYDMMQAARETWDEVLAVGTEHGFRNAQATVLAPTGTIGFMMDCDTTGIEPDIALVKYKHLVGGGMLKLVNGTVEPALSRLGYDEPSRREILAYIDENDTIEGSPQLKDEHLPVFDCALTPANGARSIAPMGHVRMMAACQPFLSGAISKTVNLPHESTEEDIEKIYIEAWRLGLKAIAIYRDGCKRTQPLTTGRSEEARAGVDTQPNLGPGMPARKRLPAERVSLTHKFEVAGHEGYLTVGYYENGQPGEIFIKMAKEGSTISGVMDSFATAVSISLQHGVPLQLLCDKFQHTRFEPSGFTNNDQIPMASSLMDYIFRWLAQRHLGHEETPHPVMARIPASSSSADGWTAVNDDDREARGTDGEGGRDPTIEQEVQAFLTMSDGPTCATCGFIMVRSGACHKCENCGATSGCG